MCIHAPDPDARCASGPACGGPVLLLQNRRTPAWLLTTHPIRQTNAKGPPCGRPFCVCLAERGGNSTLTVPPSSGGVHKPDLCPVVCPVILALKAVASLAVSLGTNSHWTGQDLAALSKILFPPGRKSRCHLSDHPANGNRWRFCGCWIHLNLYWGKIPQFNY